MFKSCLVLASCLAVGLCAPAVQNHETDNVRVSRTLFSCEEGFNSIDPIQVCDGIAQCKDSSDEDPEMCKTWVCDSSVPFKCNHSSKCIPNSMICDNHADCDDGSDENSSLCLNSDRQDSNRENGSSHWSSNMRFYCEDGVGSIRLSQVCDKTVDCSDKSDENPNLCKKWICSPNMPFRCANTSLCLADELVCNGHRDCPDGNDEDPILCDHNNVLEFASQDKALEGMFSNLERKKKLIESAKKPNGVEHQAQEFPVSDEPTHGQPNATNVTAGQPTSKNGSNSKSGFLDGFGTLFIVLTDLCISIVVGFLAVLCQYAEDPSTCY